MVKSTDFGEYDYYQRSYYILSRKFPIIINLVPSFNYNRNSEMMASQGSFMINLKFEWEAGKTPNKYFNKYLAEFVKAGMDLMECRHKINDVITECNDFMTQIILGSMDSVMVDVIEPKISELRSDSKYYPSDYQFSYHNASYQTAIEELLNQALRSPESMRKLKCIFNNCYSYLSEYIHSFVVNQMRLSGYIDDEDMFNVSIKKDENCEVYNSIFGTTFFYPNGFKYDNEVGGNV